jgi:hypothetical protein
MFLCMPACPVSYMSGIACGHSGINSCSVADGGSLLCRDGIWVQEVEGPGTPLGLMFKCRHSQVGA